MVAFLLAATPPAVVGLGADVAASSEFTRLTASMRTAYQHRDWSGYRASARSLSAFLNGSPDALLELARADARLGDAGAALAQLQAIAQMGVSQTAVGTLPDFRFLRRSPEFRAILATMASNERPTRRATRALTLSDAGLLPEDVAYDRDRRLFFVTSVLERRIVTLGPDASLRQFARAPDDWPMLAVKIDPSRGVLWATESALNGFRSISKSDWGRSAVLVYDLRSGRLLQRIGGPRARQLGDASLAPDGDLLVSDSNGGALYLARRGMSTLQPVDTQHFVSPMTPAFAPAGSVYVADYLRGIGVIATKTRQVTWLPMADRYALQGVDGLYWHEGQLIAIQNGLSPERIMLFALDRSRARIAAQLPVESGTLRLDPTHGVIVGDDFYYIANSGWSQLAADGSVRAGARLTPASLMRAHLAP